MYYVRVDGVILGYGFNNLVDAIKRFHDILELYRVEGHEISLADSGFSAIAQKFFPVVVDIIEKK